ncbi:MAG: glycosyltransferase [Desulfobulbaceae bacterium]|nr:glycosyltransferase [Desulfobulbaceae bacterium]
MKGKLKQGEVLFAEGKIEKTEKHFMSLLEENSEDVEVLNNLGVIHYQKGNVEEAENYFLKALSIKEDYLDTLLNLADLYQGIKSWQKAAGQLEKFIAIENQDVDALNRLGMFYFEMGDIEKARIALKKSLELNPKQKTIKDHLSALTHSTEKPIAPSIISRNRRPTVCVGLPVYNGGNFLSQAIESILSQDFENIELIVSDNCSTDITQEICLKYQKMDKRISYHRFEENLGAAINFKNVLGLSSAPYFMWASHDDMREQTFIAKCVEKMESDPSIALVYPRTKVLDANSKFIGIANDHVNADQDNPIERFRHLIWEIGMCNMLYGLYRINILKKVRTWDETLFVDNLILAEIALLLGKIVQIDDVLFVRRLTRNYNYRSLDERYEQLISEIQHNLFSEGITLPHCRLTYAHLELVNYAGIEKSEKDFLMNDILKCFKTRFGNKMKYEISRAIELIHNGYFYYTWNKKQSSNWHSGNLRTNDYFHIDNLLRHLREALFIFPERRDLKDVYGMCLRKVFNFKGISP